MIEKMKFITITGPKGSIDHLVNDYLSKTDIHLENAMFELSSVTSLKPFVEANPYKSSVIKSHDLLALANITDPKCSEVVTSEEAANTIDELSSKLSDIDKERQEIVKKMNVSQTLLDKIEPFRKLNYEVNEILHFKFIKYRFGRITHEHYSNFNKYVIENLNTIFYECDSDKDYVWGVYFVPLSQSVKTDAIYSSLHFERVFIPDNYTGTPSEAYEQIESEINEYNKQLQSITDKSSKILESYKEQLLVANNTFEQLNNNFDIRKLAACTRENNQVFYILCGWMCNEDYVNLEKMTTDDSDVILFVDDAFENLYAKPPTKLKNPKIFKPFEMYIKMYGLPAYNEFDPTIFVAITYSFIFGVMFGDVGQGLFLVVGGALLYKLKKMNLAAIISMCGIFSTFFGFMFGSLFGFEDVINAAWLRPISNMTTLPFIGKLNTVFVITIAFGMGLIILSMIINMINGLRSHNIEEAIFGNNGLAGLVFYGSLVTVIVLFLSGNTVPSGIVLTIMFVIPLILIALKEPLTALVEKKAEVMPEEKGMFIVQAFFEMFEVLLGYFSNTLSFVRIGAFAVSHAAMMEVVLMLAGAEHGGSPNWIVIILGNIFVCGLEGLIVGIQVLRLEYYELFSRFYKGNGREFKPFFKKINN